MEERKITKAELDDFIASLHTAPTHRLTYVAEKIGVSSAILKKWLREQGCTCLRDRNHEIHYRSLHYEIVIDAHLDILVSESDNENTLPNIETKNQ